jgi:hypothetical protein
MQLKAPGICDSPDILIFTICRREKVKTNQMFAGIMFLLFFSLLLSQRDLFLFCFFMNLGFKVFFILFQPYLLDLV